MHTLWVEGGSRYGFSSHSGEPHFPLPPFQCPSLPLRRVKSQGYFPLPNSVQSSFPPPNSVQVLEEDRCGLFCSQRSPKKATLLCLSPNSVKQELILNLMSLTQLELGTGEKGGNPSTPLSPQITQCPLSSRTSMAACVDLSLLATMGCTGIRRELYSSPATPLQSSLHQKVILIQLGPLPFRSTWQLTR